MEKLIKLLNKNMDYYVEDIDPECSTMLKLTYQDIHIEIDNDPFFIHR